jgi:hypothetical protein
MSMTRHWAIRVRERVGDVDPAKLADSILWAIRNERTDTVEFVSRVSRHGCRLFRFRAPVEGGKQFFALVDTDAMRCVTVMPPGFIVARQGKSRLHLRESDL